MKLAIITIVKHSNKDETYYGYGPYVREMNLWGKYVEELLVVGPEQEAMKEGIDSAYDHPHLNFTSVPSFDILSFGAAILAIFKIPIIFFKICKVMRRADHIHLRCPGNISLIGCFAQIFFPKKAKSTKYAGNWDPNSNQPWSYRMQQAILRNRILTRNMQVLVYGAWPHEPSHVRPFISATYYEKERIPYVPRDYTQPLKFVFAASLVEGKRPLLTVQIIEALNAKGYPSVLHLFGDGPLMDELQNYVKEKQLEGQVLLLGNRERDEVRDAYMDAHFNILPSKSEGWPKAVAEGMFFGCVPIATSVSCVDWMLDYGSRGIVIKPELDSAVGTIVEHLETNLTIMARLALEWSQLYTFDRLETDIKKVLDGTF